MNARVIAYYLPQFHPIPENDEHWGAGFTEWTNVAKAKPLFRGHYQPRVPADLGFYDLRLPEVREQQAQLAREAGIEGFCYWHYWFGNGKMLLQRPFEEVLQSGKPDFPFCLAWANHSWTMDTWNNDHGKTAKRMIAEQLYSGDEDYIAHFNYCLPAFRDKRYITVEGKPLFVLFDAYFFTDVKRFIEVWREQAQKNGLPGIYFVAITKSTTTATRREDGTFERHMPDLKSSAQVYNDILSLGFDGINSFGKPRAEMISEGHYINLARKWLHLHLPFLPAMKYDYPKVVKHMFAPEDAWDNVFPSIMPQWDRSPRVGTEEGVYVNATPENFEQHIRHALKIIEKKDDEHRILFLRAWNEWAEGNYVEPDLKHGHGFLQALARVLKQ